MLKYRNLPLIWSDNYERFGSPLFAKIKSFSTITDACGTPFIRCMWQQKINSEFPRHYQKFISGIVQIASPLSFQADARRLDRGSKRNTQTHTNYESSFNFQTTQRIRALRKRKWNYHAWISQWNQLFLRHSHWKPQNNRVFFLVCFMLAHLRRNNEAQSIKREIRTMRPLDEKALLIEVMNFWLGFFFVLFCFTAGCCSTLWVFRFRFRKRWLNTVEAAWFSWIGLVFGFSFQHQFHFGSVISLIVMLWPFITITLQVKHVKWLLFFPYAAVATILYATFL